MNILILIKKTIRDVFAHGPRHTMNKVMYRGFEEWHERRLMIRTTAYIKLDDLGINNPQCNDYAPIEYLVFHRAMKAIPHPSGKLSFVDYGSGMGRAVISAATYPFRRCIGIELSPDLHRVAQQNLQNARARLRCKEVELLNMDATHYIPADDVSVFFLFNPFKGKVLATVLENIRASLARAPREHVVLYMAPNNEKNHLDEFQWLVKCKVFHAHENRIMYLYRAASL